MFPSARASFVSASYYEDQQGQGKIDCTLARVAGQLERSPSPEPQYSAQQDLRPHEKSFLRKFDEYISQ